jgi:hypothetical protein
VKERMRMYPEVTAFVPTGHQELEDRTGLRGYPCGHLVELFGHPYATAQVIAPAIRGAGATVGVVDCDGTFAFPEGVDPAAVDLRRETTLGDALRMAQRFVVAGRRLVVVHQLDALLPDLHDYTRLRAELRRWLGWQLPLVHRHGAAVVFVTRRSRNFYEDVDDRTKPMFALRALAAVAALRLFVFQVHDDWKDPEGDAESTVIYGGGYDAPGRAGSRWVAAVMKNTLGPEDSFNLVRLGIEA